MDQFGTLLASLTEGDEIRGLVICAEPGMGRSQLISRLLGRAQEEGRHVVRRSYRGLSVAAATSRVVALAREVATSGRRSIVGIDELPASDEASVSRQANAFRRILASGTPFVLSIVPEARQLLEELDGCIVMYSGDLVIRPPKEPKGDLLELVKLSRGIPSLVWSLADAFGRGTAPAQLPVSYFDALESLTGQALRPGLSDEEQRLRLAMLLLGHGETGELEQLLGGPQSELLTQLSRHAPLFGVDGRRESFACLEPRSPTGSVGGAHLEHVCSLFPKLAIDCARLLCDRGEVARAAAICGMPALEEGLDLVLERGCEFLDAGEVPIVARSVERRGLACAGSVSEYAQVLGRACMLVGSKRARGRAAAALPSETGKADDSRGRALDALLLCEARLALRGIRPQTPLPAVGADGIAHRLSVHRQAFDLMSEGRFSEALQYLMRNPREVGATSVSGALLDLDLEFCGIALGETVARSPDLEARMETLFGPSGAEGLAGYKLCVDVARTFACGERGAVDAAAMLELRAGRSGDAVVQTVALIAGALLDLREKSAARAWARAQTAETLAQGARMGYAARVAAAIASMARVAQGETGPVQFPVSAGMPDDLDVVCAFLDEARDPVAASEAVEDLDGSVPRDALWLLLALAHGVDAGYARALRERVPRGWRRALSVMEQGWRAGNAAAGTALARPQAVEFCEGGTFVDEAPVEVHLLGDFRLRVHGREVQDKRIERRGAKSLLEYLLLRHGRGARRFEVVEQVWPDDDYQAGFGKLYKATSALRGAIDGAGEELDIFIANRSSKRVSIDAKLVRCDVDEFEQCAREAVDTLDDMKAVAMARRAELIYAGDLYQPAHDATGFVQRKGEELRALFVDAMIAGSDAALRLGQKRTATRLATRGLGADGEREDALIAKVAALRASGRVLEAERERDRHAKRLAVGGRASQQLLLPRAEEE